MKATARGGLRPPRIQGDGGTLGARRQIKSRKTQFSVPGGGRGVGRGDLKIPTPSIERRPPLCLHQSAPNVPIRRNVKKKQPPKLKFLK